MSGLCPFALHKIIPPGSSDPRITPRVAILHVDAGNAFSLHDFFKNRSGGIESHFHVRNDGAIEQYRDIYFQADANHHANDFAVSIETQGFGAGEWNDKQLASIKRLLLWLNEEASIPLRKCPAWNSSGVGYHIQFGSPGPWTPVSKSCPGPDRVRQYHDVLVPWMNGNPTEEDDMPSAKEIADAVWQNQINAIGGEPIPAARMLAQTHNRADTRRELKGIAGDLGDLEKAARDDATKGQISAVRRRVDKLLADEHRGRG